MTTTSGSIILGSGYIAGRHATALHEAGRSIVGVHSPTAENAERAARAWDSTAYASFAELLNVPGATHLHICTPTTNHAEVVVAAIERGLTIVCEKPLTVDAETARILADRASAAGVENYLTFNRRFDKGIQLMRERFAAGEIGRAVAVYGYYQQEWNAPVSTRDWRFDPEQIGPSRVVSEIGSHWFDLASYVLGAGVVSVSALTASMGERAYRQGEDTGIFKPVNEDLFASLLRFEDGAVGSLLATQLAQGAWDDITLRIDGTAGSLSWDSREPGRTQIAHKGLGVLSVGSGADTRSIEDMIAAIYRGGDTICADFEDGVTNCAVQDAVLDSAESGQWTTVKEQA